MTGENDADDERYRSQAKYLAAHTEATEKQALVFLYRYTHQHDFVSNRELADRLGMSESLFSKHLSAARDRITQPDDPGFDGLKATLITTIIGGTGGVTEQVIGDRGLRHGIGLITEDLFASEDPHASRYKAYLFYDEHGTDHLTDDAPDDIMQYTKSAVFTVPANSEDQLARSLVHYMETIDKFAAIDIVNAFELFGDIDQFSLGLDAIDEYTDAADRAAVEIN